VKRHAVARRSDGPVLDWMSNGRITRGPGCWAASLQSSAWRIVCIRTQVLGSYDGVIATSDSESATTWTSRATDLQGDASRTNRAQTRRRMIRVYFPFSAVPHVSCHRLAPSARPAIRWIAPLSSFPASPPEFGSLILGTAARRGISPGVGRNLRAGGVAATPTS